MSTTRLVHTGTERDRQTERQRQRDRERQTDRQRDRQADRDRESQRLRNRERHRETETETATHREGSQKWITKYPHQSRMMESTQGEPTSDRSGYCRAISSESTRRSAIKMERPYHESTICVSRFGPAVRRWAGKQKDLGSIPLRLSFLFKRVVVCGHCLVTLSLRIHD